MSEKHFVYCEVTIVSELSASDGLLCKPIHGKPWEVMTLDRKNVMNEDKLRELGMNIDSAWGERVRDRFRGIINGPGTVIPRVAVKVALDDLFGRKE